MATNAAYSRERTALLFVDPYNDFLSEGGKIYPRIKPVADEVGLLDNLRRLDRAVREAGIQVVIVPHRRWEPGDYEAWDHPNPTQRSIMDRHSALLAHLNDKAHARNITSSLLYIFTHRASSIAE